MAGNNAWSGVLVALDGVLDVKANLKSRRRADFKDYMEAVTKRDRKMSKPLLYAYESLHKVLGYDGNLSYGTVQDGMKQAKAVIDWADREYRKQHP